MTSFGVQAWLRHLRKALLEKGCMNVPCGDCSACCTSPEMEVDLCADDDPAQYTCHTDPELGWVLDKRADGACVYLQGGRCSIYHRRPVACRIFDCRVYLLAGVRGHNRDGAEAPHSRAAWDKFKLVYKEPGDEHLHLVVLGARTALAPFAPDNVRRLAAAAVGVGIRYMKEGLVSGAMALIEARNSLENTHD